LEEFSSLRDESFERTSKGFPMRSNPSGHSITETVSNKMFMQHIFAELAKGNRRPFAEAMADDFCWIITGSSSWARTYRGKAAVRTELLDPLFAQFAGEYSNSAQRFIAEEDYVVVQCRGNVITKKGEAYNNSYCYVIRLAGGKMRELTEYMDTALTERVLTAPE
jgi:ketosteroid isomerase-like protein